MYQVLLVDDEVKIIQWLSKTIPWEKYGFSVCELCTDSLQALQYMECHPVDLVITDIRMPGLNGLDLIRKLHECRPGVRTIILSGYNQFEYAQQALKYGVKRFLLKPLNPDELTELLAELASEMGGGSPSPQMQENSLFPLEMERGNLKDGAQICSAFIPLISGKSSGKRPEPRSLLI